MGLAEVEGLLSGVNWKVEPRVQFNVEKLFWLASVVLTVFKKFVPVTVSVGLLPTVTQVGETEVTVGARFDGLLMMKLRGLERPLVPVP